MRRSRKEWLLDGISQEDKFSNVGLGIAHSIRKLIHLELFMTPIIVACAMIL